MDHIVDAAMFFVLVWTVTFLVFLVLMILERLWAWGDRSWRELGRGEWNGKPIRFFPPRREGQDWDAYLYKRREAEDVDDEEGL